MRKLKNEELNRIGVEEYKTSKKLPIVLVLDNIRSLSNIGSVFRTADGFRIEAIHLCGITAKPPHREIHKTALGATESVDWKYFENTVDSLKELKGQDFKILLLEQIDNSIPLHDFNPVEGEKYALVVGNEVRGVDENCLPLADACLEIVQFGTKHSFNVSISTAMALYHIALKVKYFDLLKP